MPKEVTPSSTYDAIPTISYALTALKRSGGDQKSPYWKHYADAVAHFSQVHGEGAGKQLQDIAYQTANNKGDMNSELIKFSKRAIDTNQPYHPALRNIMAMAYDGQNPLDKYDYSFDMAKSTPGNNEQLQTKIEKIFKK